MGEIELVNFRLNQPINFSKKRHEVPNSNQSIIPQESNVWSKLWKINIVPRHLQLMWRILHQRLPVREALFKRGLNCSPFELLL
jgi:hypothetical protein